MIPTITHELIHNLLLGANLEYVKKEYPEEARKVRVHILVHAIHEHIYLKFFEKERLERDKERMASIPEYKRAWDIVEKEGHERIVEKLREKN